MTINWQEVIITLIATLGGGGLALGAVAWLTKALISHGLTREAEAFKVQLKADADREIEGFKIGLQANANTEIERLKNMLQMAAEEHRVRFAKLHENRAQRIADLYERITALSADCQGYVFQFGEPDRRVGFLELEKKFSELNLFFETSRIYLPEHVCVLMEKVIKTVRKPGIDVFVYTQVNDFARPEVLKEKNDSLIAAVKAFEAEIPEAKRALEDEFRKMLGVDN